MTDEFLRAFADELKKIRESEGFTIKSLHEKTRIEERYLQAIEEARFNVIADVYMKSFIKSYVKALGLNEQEYINKYEKAKSGIDFNAPDIEEENNVETGDTEIENNGLIADNKDNNNKRILYNQSKDSEAAKMKRDFNIIIYIFLTVVVALIIAIVLIVRGNKQEIIIEKSFEEVMNEQEARYKVKEELKDSSFVYSNGKLNVKLVVTEPVWFGIKKDNGELFEVFLRKGQDSMIVADKVMEINIGNTDGANIYLNNVKINLPGKVSKVKNIRIDPSGINEIAPLIRKNKNDSTRSQR
jgi:transcriptional regulator with XRE-family HTH domain